MMSGNLWHKPNEKSPWMRKFVVANGPTVRIYGTREEFNSNNEPINAIELLSDSNLKIGSDNVVYVGPLVKKGMLKWTDRWGALLHTGYLNYMDSDFGGHKSIDLNGFTAETEDPCGICLAKKSNKIHFRFENTTLRSEWFRNIESVIRDLKQARRQKSGGSNEPTLYPFMVIKPQGETHFFCCANQNELKQWEMAVSAEISKIDPSAQPADGSFSKSTGGRRSLVTSIQESQMTDAQLEEEFNILLDTLKLPQKARQNMSKLDKQQKIAMINSNKQRVKQKPKQDGREWANKLGSDRAVSFQTLQTFAVVLRDESEAFVKDFIHELGLNHLCRLSGQKKGVLYDKELLNVFKAILDTPGTLEEIIRHELCIRVIVDKLDMADIRGREMTLKLLVALVVTEEGGDLGLIASSKVLAALTDHARVNGDRNRWKRLLTQLSVKDPLNGSTAYDALALTLVNFLLMSLQTSEQRNEERRLMAAVNLDKLLRKLEDRAHRQSMKDAEYAAQLSQQVQAYRQLATEDSRASAAENQNLDMSNPKELFAKVHDQSLEDGYINELTKILANLIALPPDADIVWYNISRVVGEACRPTQTQMWNRGNKRSSEHRDGGKSFLSAKQQWSRRANASAVGSDNSNSTAVEANYPSYQELVHLLKVREEDVRDKKKQEEDGQIKKLQEENLQLDSELSKASQQLGALKKELEAMKTEYQELKANPPVQVVAASAAAAAPAVGAAPAGGQSALMASIAAKKGGAPPVAAAAAVAAAPDPYLKYRKMQKMGLPPPAVANKMRQDKIDAGVIESFEKSGELPPAPAGGAVPAAAAAVAAAPDPYTKYRKMQKMKLPTPAIANKMRQDKIDAGVIESFEKTGELPAGGAAPAASSAAAAATPADKPAAKEELTEADKKTLAKYLKMQKMNLPQPSIINKMKMDKIDPSLINKLFPGAVGAAKKGGGGPPKPKKPELPPNLKPKKVIKPGVKMRNLHWTPVNPFDVEKTIWNDVDDGKVKIDTKQLESQFCWKEIERKTPEKSSAAAAKPADEEVRVLEGKRSYNVEIFLSRMKMKNWDVREAMLKMDDSQLNLEKITKFANFVPTPEEAAMMKEFENEKHLAKAEEFFKVVKNVDSNLPQRLELWAFKLQFDELVGAEQEKIAALRGGLLCVEKSANLRKMFAYVLAVGNYMNGSTKKGQAFGFKLGSLSQLSRSRTVDNQRTLLVYLYQYLEKKDSKVLHFVNELLPLNDACTVDIPTLRSNVGMIRSRVNAISGRLKKAENESAARGDRFVAVMGPWHSQATKRFENLDGQLKALSELVKKIGGWLNEGKDMNAAYLKTLNTFRCECQNVKKTLAAKKEREAKAHKKNAFLSSLKKEQTKRDVKKDAPEQKQGPATNKKGGVGNLNPQRTSHNTRKENVSDNLLKSVQMRTGDELLSRLKMRGKALAGKK